MKSTRLAVVALVLVVVAAMLIFWPAIMSIVKNVVG